MTIEPIHGVNAMRIASSSDAMSLEDMAFRRLKTRHPELQKNGLRKALRAIDLTKECCTVEDWRGPDEMNEPRCMPINLVGDINLHCIPDATLVDYARETLMLFEIEDTSKLTKRKMRWYEGLSMDVFDESGWWVEIWVVCRYGIEEKMIYTSKMDVAGHGPDGVWRSVYEAETVTSTSTTQPKQTKTNGQH